MRDKREIVESFDDIEIYKNSAFMNKIAVQAMQEEKEKNKNEPSKGA